MNKFSKTSAVVIVFMLSVPNVFSMEDEIGKALRKNSGNEFKGANLHATDNKGKSPLMYATKHDEVSIIKLFIERSINLEQKDYKGRTALIHAVKHKGTKVAKYLINNGANINATDNEGKTPLIYALDLRNIATVKFLIKNGANIHVKDKDGITPFAQIINLNNEEINKLFIERLKQRNLKESLRVAAEKKHQPIIRAIFDKYKSNSELLKVINEIKNEISDEKIQKIFENQFQLITAKQTAREKQAEDKKRAQKNADKKEKNKEKKVEKQKKFLKKQEEDNEQKRFEKQQQQRLEKEQAEKKEKMTKARTAKKILLNEQQRAKKNTQMLLAQNPGGFVVANSQRRKIKTLEEAQATVKKELSEEILRLVYETVLKQHFTPLNDATKTNLINVMIKGSNGIKKGTNKTTANANLEAANNAMSNKNAINASQAICKGILQKILIDDTESLVEFLEDREKADKVVAAINLIRSVFFDHILKHFKELSDEDRETLRFSDTGIHSYLRKKGARSNDEFAAFEFAKEIVKKIIEEGSFRYETTPNGFSIFLRPNSLNENSMQKILSDAGVVGVMYGKKDDLLKDGKYRNFKNGASKFFSTWLVIPEYKEGNGKSDFWKGWDFNLTLSISPNPRAYSGADLKKGLFGTCYIVPPAEAK